MGTEQKQILEAVTQFRTEIDKELQSIRLEMSSLYTGVDAAAKQADADIGKHDSRLTGMEEVAASHGRRLESLSAAVVNVTSSLETLTTRLDALERLVEIGGMAVDAIRKDIEDYHTSVDIRLNVAAEGAVERYVSARKKNRGQ